MYAGDVQRRFGRRRRAVGFLGCGVLALGAACPAIAQPCEVGEWTEILRAPEQRVSAAYDTARQTIVWFNGSETFESPTGEEWVLRSASGPPARVTSAMVYDEARGVCVLFGGASFGDIFGDTWEWDGHVWTIVSNSGPFARFGQRMVYDSQNSRTILYGGCTSVETDNPPFMSDVWSWDGSHWSLLDAGNGDAPSARFYPGLCYDASRQRVVLFGGYRFGKTFETYGDTWEFDGAGWSQMVTSDPPAARQSPGMVYDPIRQVSVMYGGIIGGLAFDTWEWNGTAWSLRSASSDAGGRNGHVLIHHPSMGKVLSIGGSSSGATFPAWTVWGWNGEEWDPVGDPATAPDRITSAAMAYDPERERTVMFGGTGRRDTWEFDGSVWMLRSSSGPAARGHHAMTYDSARGVVVLFGGFGVSNYYDTWVWDGTVWTRAGAPEAGLGVPSNGMAFDAHRNVAVCFSEAGETWEWNGSAWTLAASKGPAARINAAMAFDRVRQRTVLYGGRVGRIGPRFNDTWEWDGTVWTIRNPTQSPGQRDNHKMVYDAVRQRIVMFGGQTGVITDLHDTWEWDGGNWVLVDAAGPMAQRDYSMAFDEALNQIVFFGGHYTPEVPGSGHATWVRRVGPVGPDLTFVAQPSDWSVETLRGVASFSVVVEGVGLAYRWRKDSVPLSDNDRISGSTSATLSINLVLPGDAGVYDVVVSNACTAVTSEPATLGVYVCPSDFNRDAFANSQDFFDFLHAFFVSDSAADFDGSGTVDSTDFFAFVEAFFAGCLR